MPRIDRRGERLASWLSLSKNNRSLMAVLRQKWPMRTAAKKVIAIACEQLGLDANKSADRNAALYILAEIEFGELIPKGPLTGRRGRGPPVKWTQERADRINKRLRALKQAGHKIPSKLKARAAFLHEHFPEEYFPTIETLAKRLSKTGN
jgi:hypothetical protein